MLDSVSPTADTRAILLLCGRFGVRRPGLKPLTQGEFRELDRSLDSRRLSPSSLLDNGAAAKSLAGLDGMPPVDRVAALLGRQGELEEALGAWQRKGVWVLSDRDRDYPQRFRQRLGSARPPLLFGAGPKEFLSQGGICIVGSRDSAEPALDFARKLGSRCGEDGLTVISSDMRGVDRETISSALAAGGNVISVLSDSLEKTLAAPRHREALAGGRFAMVTSFSPDARFTVANAMRTYKYQYALSDAAVVVETRRKGGIWSGADENRKEGWVPAFVRTGDNMSPGNMALLHLGLYPIALQDVDGPRRMSDFFMDHTARFHGLQPQPQPGADSGLAGRCAPLDLYTVFLAELAAVAASEPRSEAEIMGHFGIERAQVRKWLQRATREGKIARLESPVRYVVDPATS